jgi:hypothetical protein
LACPNAVEVKKENPITDKHKDKGNHFQCLILTLLSGPFSHKFSRPIFVPITSSSPLLAYWQAGSPSSLLFLFLF